MNQHIYDANYNSGIFGNSEWSGYFAWNDMCDGAVAIWSWFFASVLPAVLVVAMILLIVRSVFNRDSKELVK